ncbi:hypothetical protein C8Q75DRAFT_807679 [Abortiporus biennis]|nr:hypothetical protein C8Q75DRAFT_807679 [Abortiporus biennis]
MYSSKHAAARQQQQHLNYFQQSPVRGQLEPSDGFSKSGWRYLQCTDTPNELRVLLPPRTALIYSQLLKAETVELAKDKAASWDRIMQIRHLKDRMIRKCQRIARTSTTRDKNTSRTLFFTVHAPPDFRLKEMERWFRSQGSIFPEPEPDAPSPPPPSTPLPYSCSQCAAQLQAQSAQQHTHHVRRPSASSHRQVHVKATTERVHLQRRPSTSSHTMANTSRNDDKTKPIPVPHRPSEVKVRIPRHSEPLRTVRPPPCSEKSRPVTPSHEPRLESPHPVRSNVISPDPIPIPFRSRDLDDHGEARAFTASPLSYAEELPREPSPVDTLVNNPSQEQIPFPSKEPLETIHEKPDHSEPIPRPTLPRRRSSLKKVGSMSRLSIVSQAKSVTWAMDRDWEDQMGRYDKVTNEAELAARELDEVREVFYKDVFDMKRLCRHIVDEAERAEALGSSSFAIGEQEAKLAESGQLMESKESYYRAKVLAVMEETKRVVQLCDKKRDQRDS